MSQKYVRRTVVTDIKGFLKKKVKLIFHQHGRLLRKKWYHILFLKLAKNEVDLFIAVSKAISTKLKKESKISKEKIKLFYNAINFKYFKYFKDNENKKVQKLRKKFNIKSNELVIGFMGSLNENKGCHFLIKALSCLRLEFKALIIGSGNQEKKLKKMVKKLNLNSKVIFCGYQKERKIYLALFDILVIPSIYESFGITALEGQANKVPVIASNTGGLSEILKDKQNSLFFQTKNHLQLVEKIKKLHKNKKLRKKLILHGLKNIKKYNLSKYLNKLNKIYNE